MWCLPALLLVLAGCQPDASTEAPVAAAVVEPVPASLEYELLYTAGASADQELPMLVAVHGLGDRPESFARLYQDLPLAARVVLPRAPTPTRSGGGSWFAFRRNDPDREGFGRQVHEAAQDVVTLLDGASREHETAGLPVITGFSQGGMISFAVAVGWPRQIAAAVPVGGDLALSLLPPAGEAGPGLPPVTAFHGEADEVVPIAPVEIAVHALGQLGYDAELRSYADLGHGLDAAMRRDYHAELSTLLAAQAPPAEVPAAAK